MSQQARQPWFDAPNRFALPTALLMVWLVSLPRLIPSTGGDHGTYLSVAERLRAGDRLYVDVWDNKDPVFHYVLAFGRAVLPLGDLAIELLWIAGAVTGATMVATAVGASRRVALLAGGFGTPIILAGSAYIAGMTHLPGTTVCLLALATALRQQWLATGALLALLVVTKLMMLPVVGLAVVVLLVRAREVRGGLRTAIGGLLGLGAVAAVLALRGELVPFLQMQDYNVGYANGPIVDSTYGIFIGHLLRVVSEDGRGGILATLVVTVLVALSVRPRSGPRRDLRACIWATLLAEVVVLGFTGFWPHHAQVFGVSSVLALVFGLTATLAAESSPTPRAIAATALVAYLLGGATHPYWYLENVRGVATSVRAMRSPSPEAEALLATAPTGRYARLGTNDVTAHARGLGSWSLACAKFQIYPMDPPVFFEHALTCLDRVDAVLLDASFIPAVDPTTPQKPIWDSFVARAHARIDVEFSCSPHPWGQLCVRNVGVPGSTG